MTIRIRIKLKELLEEANMTQKELSALTNIRPASISEMYRGMRTSVNIRQLEKVAEAFGITYIEDLIEFKTQDEESNREEELSKSLPDGAFWVHNTFVAPADIPSRTLTELTRSEFTEKHGTRNSRNLLGGIPFNRTEDEQETIRRHIGNPDTY